jgi:small subunit ribosomal protein S9
MKKALITSGKRKESIAKATITAGKGIVTINKISLDAVMPKLARMRMQEPIVIAGDYSKSVDIEVSVMGGGYMGQANAARVAIGKALAEFSGNKAVKSALLDYDRALLVSDVRRKETRKPNTHGNARAKVQKSYR